MSALAVGTTSLLFTDIEGSTKLLQQLGDAYASVLADHHRVLREAFAAKGGIELDNAGDGFYYRFPSARAAVAAAVDCQRALTAFAWPDGVELRVRMGLHTGEPLDAEIGLVGIDVHRTARICAAGHGGQVLLSRTARDLAGRELPAGVTLLDLGEHRLKDLAEPEQLFQVVADGLATDFPPLRTLDDRPTNLPRRLSTFVGREQELAEGREMLAGSPLVTLTGPGGVGKTRLALQIALVMLDDLPDGVWLAELGTVTEEGLVLQAVAEALKVTEEPGRPLVDTVLDHLRARRLCIVLDNCEHVLGACAEIAYNILRDTDTRILATSREALGVEGERVLPVPSLELPSAERPTAASALRSAAVRLFLDRATAAQPSFALTDENAAAVVQLCRRLDGMPLALELAAARVRALPVAQIAARLDDRFRLLTGGSRMAVTRHQTLRATMDWSHDLLAEDERAVFRRLAAFGGGGCSLAAAEAVAAGDDVVSEDVLDILTRLVDKSLILAAASGSEARFTMHETVRAYARDKLVDAGEAENVLRRHRDWYLELVERAKPEFFRGPPPLDWLAVFDREQDNLRLALEWSAAEAGGAAEGLRLAAGLWRYWEIRSRVVEGRLWLERTLLATDGDVSSLRANALTGAGILAHIAGDYPAAIAYHEQSLAQHRELGNRPSVAYALHNLANVTAEHGDLARARELYEEAAAMTETIGDRHGSATGLIALADVISRQEDYAAAQPSFARARALYIEFGDRWGQAFALDSEGLAAARSGELEVARRLHEEAIDISREIGDERGVARSMLHLADEAVREGDVTRAKSLHRECLRIRRTLRDMPGTATALERLASVVMTEAAEDAAHLLGVAQNLRETINTPLPPGARADYERCVQWLAARMGPDAFEVARRAGRSLDMDAAVKRVLGDEGDSPPGSAGLATSLPAPG